MVEITGISGVAIMLMVVSGSFIAGMWVCRKSTKVNIPSASNNTGSPKLPTVDDCIEYVESCWGEVNIRSTDRLLISNVLEFIGRQLRASA